MMLIPRVSRRGPETIVVMSANRLSRFPDETNIHQEWEAVPSNLSPVTVDQPYLPLAVPLDQQQQQLLQFRRGTIHHQYQPPGGVTASLVTSAFASVSSFWKGWTGK